MIIRNCVWSLLKYSLHTSCWYNQTIFLSASRLDYDYQTLFSVRLLFINRETCTIPCAIRIVGIA